MERDEYEVVINNVKEEFVRIINDSKLPMPTISMIIKGIGSHIDNQIEQSLRLQYKKNTEVMDECK